MSTPRRVTLLTNPASGQGRGSAAAQRAVVRLQRRGVDVVELIGSDAAHARRLLDEALEDGTDAMVIAGGDGMISLVLQALAQSDVPLGNIPAGTGNDHAREFGIPRDDPEAAADIVATGRTETIDLGRIEAADGTVRSTGAIEFEGKPIGTRSTENVVRLGIAHVPQGRGTFTNMTVEENLQLGAISRSDKGAIGSDIERMYEHFPVLKQRYTQQAGTLSGGEQQMLAWRAR